MNEDESIPGNCLFNQFLKTYNTFYVSTTITTI